MLDLGHKLLGSVLNPVAMVTGKPNKTKIKNHLIFHKELKIVLYIVQDTLI